MRMEWPGEVQGKWHCSMTIDVIIEPTSSSKDADEDEGNEDQAVKVVDIVDSFRLQKQPSSGIK